MNKDYFRIVHKIITAGHQITDQVGKVLKSDDISEPQYNVLRILKEAKNEPVSVKDIQSKMVQVNSNVTRIIDKLEKKEMVSRQVCPSNRRKVDVVLTAIGAKELMKYDQKVYAIHAEKIDVLTAKELQTLNQLLTKLNY